MAEQRRHGVVDISGEAGDRRKSAHQEEERHRGEIDVREHARGLVGKQRQRRRPARLQRDAGDADDHHGEANRHLREDQREQGDEAKRAYDERRHRWNTRAQSRAATITCTMTASHRMTSTPNQKGAIGICRTNVVSCARAILAA